MRTDNTNPLMGIWAAHENDIYAVGIGGVVLHYEGKDWTTLWIVRRNVLTEIHAAMGRRGKNISAAETGFYRRALLFLKPLCDESARSMRTELVARLSKMSGK